MPYCAVPVVVAVFLIVGSVLVAGFAFDFSFALVVALVLAFLFFGHSVRFLLTSCTVCYSASQFGPGIAFAFAFAFDFAVALTFLFSGFAVQSVSGDVAGDCAPIVPFLLNSCLVSFSAFQLGPGFASVFAFAVALAFLFSGDVVYAVSGDASGDFAPIV